MVSEVSDEVRRTGGAEERVGNSVDRLKTQRDASFLRWRYGQHPHIQYYAESVGPDANPDGLLLYRTNLRSGLREIMIDDMFARERKYDVRNALLDQLCSRVDAHYVVAHAADGSPLLQSLRRFGFRRVPRRRITLVAKSLTDELQPDPFREANWSLCLGDIEGL
jgi:hypothetical protein